MAIRPPAPWKPSLLGTLVGVVAYHVMPDGPWYRMVGAYLLAVLAGRIYADHQ